MKHEPELRFETELCEAARWYTSVETEWTAQMHGIFADASKRRKAIDVNRDFPRARLALLQAAERFGNERLKENCVDCEHERVFHRDERQGACVMEPCRCAKFVSSMGWP